MYKRQAQDDYLGYSVSVSGNYAIAGTPGDDSGGAVYILYRASGSSTWSQQAKIEQSDETAGDEFGGSVSISGDYIIVSAWKDDDGGSASGSAYIFVRSGTSWSQQAKLVASDAAAGDNFGGAVSISGDNVIVGAPFNDDSATNSGSAYIYKRYGASWRIDKKVVANDPAQDDYYGISVAIDNDYIAVGAPRKDASATDQGIIYVIERKALVDAGSAQVYNYDGTSWNQIGQTLYGKIQNADLGSAVSINNDGSRIAIGEPDNGNGNVRIYDYSNSLWVQLGSDIGGENSGDAFGVSLSLDADGDRVIIGAEGNDDGGSDAGHTRIYEYSSGSWSQLGSDIDGDTLTFEASVDGNGSAAIEGSTLSVIPDEDFNGDNDDISAVIDSFTNIIGFPNIEFRLATKDPDGNCTYGITRTASPLTEGNDEAARSLISWPDQNYVNVYVIKSM